MFDAKKNSTGKQNGLDISEYIPGNDLKNPVDAEEQVKRRKTRRKTVFLWKLTAGLLSVIVSVLLMLWLGAEAHEEGTVWLIQYVFLYFILEAVFAENIYTLFLSAGMLVCFWLFTAHLIPLNIFIYLTFAALVVFSRLEHNKWLLIMNYSMIVTWFILSFVCLVSE